MLQRPRFGETHDKWKAMRKKTSRKGGVIGSSGLLLVGFESDCFMQLYWLEKFVKKEAELDAGLGSFSELELVGVKKNTGVCIWPYAGFS